MAKRTLDPKDFTKGTFQKTGSVREPLLVEGTLSCGGKEASQFTRCHGPVLVQGTLNAENTHFEAGLQSQGYTWLSDCKVNSQAGFAGRVTCKDTTFKDQITTVQGSSLNFEKCRVQDVRLEPAPWRWQWMAMLSRWIGRVGIVLEDSTIHNVSTSGKAHGVIILKGQSKILGRLSNQVKVVDRRPKAIRVAELKTRPSH